MPRVHLWDWAPSRRLEGSGQKASGLAPADAVMWGEGSCRGGASALRRGAGGLWKPLWGSRLWSPQPPGFSLSSHNAVKPLHQTCSLLSRRHFSVPRDAPHTRPSPCPADC